MKSAAKIVAVLALTGLLDACSGHKPAITTSTTTPTTTSPTMSRSISSTIPSVKPRGHVDWKVYYIQPPKLPELTGQWTVADIQQMYGADVKNKLNYYFDRAKVSYPPREVILVALKQEKKLELWARDSGEFRFIRDYYILAASGVAGPKLRQGDRQVPEGIYRISELNPNSHYHLSMKINYPNEFDLSHAWPEGRTDPGSDIFIHGKAASIGCLAMGDEAIEELFVLTAQVGTENVKVVIAPHDPRIYPLEVYSEGLPAWTTELYSIISREIRALSPVAKSAKKGL